MEQSRKAYRVLMGRPEGERLLGSPRSRWKDNIKMDLKDLCCDIGIWIDFAEDRVPW